MLVITITIILFILYILIIKFIAIYYFNHIIYIYITIYNYMYVYYQIKWHFFHCLKPTNQQYSVGETPGGLEKSSSPSTPPQVYLHFDISSAVPKHETSNCSQTSKQKERERTCCCCLHCWNTLEIRHDTIYNNNRDELRKLLPHVRWPTIRAD